MYSLILMTAMTASAPEAPQFGLCHQHACSGCVGCYGCTGCFGYSCHGCTGCYGYSSCFGCTGCIGYSSCHGCCGGGRGGLGLFHRRSACCGGGCCGGFYSSCSGCCGGMYLSCSGCCGGTIFYGAPVAPPPGTPAPPAPIMTRSDYARRIWGANWTYSDSVPFQPVTPPPPPIRYDNTPKVEKKVSVEDNAKLIIEVPANAKLYIDGSLTKSNSQVRHFYTPPLDPGQLYFYDVRVEFERNGQTVQQEKRIYVKAGDVFHASFKAGNSANANVVKN